MMLQTLPADSGWRLLKIQGQLDLASSPTVEMAIAHVASDDAHRVLVDLEDIKAADAKGIGTVVSAVRRLLAENPAIRVAFVASDEWLASKLARGVYPAKVAVFRSGIEALAHIRGTKAA